MNEDKQLIELIRSQLKAVESNIAKLVDLDVAVTLDVGTDKKTVSFENIKHIEFLVTGKVQQSL